MNKGKCTAISPIVFVRNMERAINFYVGVLGFEIGVKQEGYAYIVREDVAIRLIAAESDGESKEQSCYICVDNLDDLYEERRAELESLPSGRIRKPFDQPYGQREFHVIDEDGLLIYFGEAIRESAR